MIPEILISRIKNDAFQCEHIERYSNVLEELTSLQICIIIEKLAKNNEYRYLGSTNFLPRRFKFNQCNIWCNTCGNVYNINLNISRHIACTCLFDEYIYTGSSINYLMNWSENENFTS